MFPFRFGSDKPSVITLQIVGEETHLRFYYILAERQKRIREAKESGRKQLEERRRREEDKMFKQVRSVFQ